MVQRLRHRLLCGPQSRPHSILEHFHQLARGLLGYATLHVALDRDLIVLDHRKLFYQFLLQCRSAHLAWYLGLYHTLHNNCGDEAARYTTGDWCATPMPKTRRRRCAIRETRGRGRWILARSDGPDRKLYGLLDRFVYDDITTEQTNRMLHN